mgnify:CR=1 FL=1
MKRDYGDMYQYIFRIKKKRLEILFLTMKKSFMMLLNTFLMATMNKFM